MALLCVATRTGAGLAMHHLQRRRRSLVLTPPVGLPVPVNRAVDSDCTASLVLYPSAMALTQDHGGLTSALTIDDLPLSLLTATLVLLPVEDRGRAAAVCKAWELLLRQPLLWQHVWWAPDAVVSPAALEALALKKGVLSLQLPDASAMRPAFVAAAVASMPQLKQLRAVGLSLPWSGALLAGVISGNPFLSLSIDVFTAGEATCVDALLRCMPHCSARFFHVAGRLSLSGSSSLSHALASNALIRNLNLSFCGLDDAAVQVLAAGIRGSSALRSLAMRANQFGDAGGVAIVNALSGGALTNLSLSSNAVAYATASALGLILPYTSLEAIDFSHNSLCADSAVALSTGVARSLTLRSLNVSFNRLRPRGVVAIASALGVGAPKLNYLELEWTGAGGVGAVSLAHHLLHRKQPLHRLGLSSNQVNVVGTTALGQALASGLALITLGLSNNPIGDAGLQAIASSFTARVSGLARLEVSNCLIREEGACFLARCLASKNCCISAIDCAGNKIGGHAVNVLLRALCENASITELAIAVPPVNGYGPDVECLLQRETSRATWTGTPNWGRMH